MSRATPKDLGLALLVAFLIAEGPLTPAALGPSLVAGAIGAGIFLYFRLSRIPSRKRALTTDTPARQVAPAPSWEIPRGVWICLAVVAAAVAPTVIWMYSEWTGSVWHNTHGMLMPVLMVLLGRNILRRMKPTPDPPSVWGYALLVPGLLLVAIDVGAGTRYLASIGLVLCIPGLCLLLLGPKRTRALALPLTLGIFMIPLPNTFASQIYLRTLTADSVGPILNLLGIPTLVQDSMLELSGSSFLVANSCSGFSTLYATLAMAVLLGTLCEQRSRRIIIYLSILPLAFFANIVRVVMLVLGFLYVDESLLETSAHAASGVFTFFAVLGVLILVSNRPSLARALL